MISQLRLDVTGLVSVWCEAVLYGMYCTLFIESVYFILVRKQIQTTPARVFFGATLLMFAIATTHIALNLYRLLRGYVWLAPAPGPTIYFNDLGRVENVAHDAINAIMSWIGDFLVIYRCFIVWNNNYYIIALPALMLVMSIAANGVALHLFAQARATTIFSPAFVHWMNTIYALAFVQNVLTTGMIVFRLLRHERTARALGVYSAGSRASLLPVVRVVVESAMVYALEVLVLIVLYALDHNGQFIVQEAIVPTVGIVFTMISVRLTMRREAAAASTATSTMTAGDKRSIEWRIEAGTSVDTEAEAEPLG